MKGKQQAPRLNVGHDSLPQNWRAFTEVYVDVRLRSEGFQQVKIKRGYIVVDINSYKIKNKKPKKKFE